METAILGVRRFIAHGRLFATVAAVVLVITMLVVGLFAYLALAATTGVRETLSAASATDAAVRAQIRLADDPGAQTARVTEILEGLLGPVPVAVHRTLQSDPLDATIPDGSDTTLVIGSDPELEQRASLQAGSWPASGRSPAEAVMQADAAELVGVVPGDVVTVGEDETAVQLVISGTWLATDPTDPYWFADPAVANGTSGTAFGPLVIAEPDFAGFSTRPYARWTVIPDAARISEGDVAALDTAVGGMEAALRADDALSASGVIFDGDLHATLATLEGGTNAVRGISPVPVVLVGAIGIMAIVQLARLLSIARATETALLRARGTSARQLTIVAAIEGAAVAILSAAAGAALAIGTIRILGEPRPPWAVAALVAAGTVVISITTMALTAALDARAPSTRDATVASGRVRRAAGVAPVVFAVVAAGISLWQFLLYGSPLVTSASGEQHVDLVAVLAPSLGLVACCTVGLLLFPVVARLVERRTTSSARFTRVIARAQVARRVVVFAVPVLLVSLAVGGTTVAASYAETWTRLTATAGQLRTGGDVLVSLPSRNAGASRSIVTSAPYLHRSGVTDAAPVLVADITPGDVPGTLVAIDGSALPRVVGTLGGSLDATKVAGLLGGRPAGLPLPAGTTGVTITSTATLRDGSPFAVDLRLWLMDAQGALAALVPDPDSGTASVPPGAEPWTVLAVDATLRLAPPTTIDVRVDGITADAASGSTDLDLGSAGNWDAQPLAYPDSADLIRATGTGLEFTAFPRALGQSPTARLMPVNDSADGPAAVPTVVSTALADRLGLGTGDSVTLQFAGSGIEIAATVAGATDLVPGSVGPAGALVDLRLADEQLLRTSNAIPAPNQVWLASPDPDAVTTALSEASPDARVSSRTTGTGAALLGSAAVALWTGAIGALALAAVAVSAILASLVTSRRGEVTVFRVLGMTAGQQAASRRRELFWVVGYAVVLGLLSGALVSMLVVPDLARSAVLGASALLPAPIGIAVLPFIAALGAFAAVVLAIGATYSRRVAAQAATARPRDDVQ